MEQLNFDDGTRKIQVNGGEFLRFNPRDPNLYHRFFEAMAQIDRLAREYAADQTVSTGEVMDTNGFPREPAALAAVKEYDRKVKALLSDVFGKRNDFDRILNGMNVLAVASNGKPIITNFLEALAPIISESADLLAKSRAAAAVEQAEKAREQREANE